MEPAATVPRAEALPQDHRLRRRAVTEGEAREEGLIADDSWPWACGGTRDRMSAGGALTDVRDCLGEESASARYEVHRFPDAETALDARRRLIGAVDCDGPTTWPGGGSVDASDRSGVVISSGLGMDDDGPEDTAWLYVAHHGDRLSVLRVLVPTGSVRASGDGRDRTPGCLADLLDIRTANGAGSAGRAGRAGSRP